MSSRGDRVIAKYIDPLSSSILAKFTSRVGETKGSHTWRAPSTVTRLSITAGELNYSFRHADYLHSIIDIYGRRRARRSGARRGETEREAR